MESESPRPDAGPPRSRERAAGVALAGLLVLELALVWSHPRLPTNDGPEHQYSAWVAHRLRVDPGGPLARWFELNPRTIYPNVGYSWFLQALADRVPMASAEKLGASLFLLALPAAVALFARSWGRRGDLAALVAVALSLGFPFFMGFFNFLWGVPLALLFWANVGALIRERSLARLLLSNLLLALTFCAHLVAFAVAAGGGLVLLAAAWRRRPWMGLLGLLPVVAVAPRFWPRTVGLGAAFAWQEGPVERLIQTLGMGVATAHGGAERVGAAVVGVGLCALLAAGLRRVAARSAPLLWLVAALFVLALASPSAVGSGSFLGERVMLFFWLAAAAAIEPPHGRWRIAAAALLAAAVVVHLAALEIRMRSFDRELADYLAAVREIPAGAALYGYSYTAPHRELVAAPMATADALVHLELASPDFRLYQAVPPDAPYFPIRYTVAGRARHPRRALHGRLPLFRIQGWAEALLVWCAPPTERSRIERDGRYRQVFVRGRTRLFVRQGGGAGAGSGRSQPGPTTVESP